MFKSIALENFKAFGRRTSIELAPITLIFGQNSAGKSSILQAFSLLKQTRESREPGAPLLPRAEGGVTDLGSFQELLFDHDLERTVSIGLQIDARRGRLVPATTRRWVGAAVPESVGLSVDFSRPNPEEEVGVRKFTVDWSPLEGPLATFLPRTLNERERKLIDEYYWYPPRGHQRAQQRKLRVADCQQLSPSEHLWNGIYAAWASNSVSVVRALETLTEEDTSARVPYITGTDTDDPSDLRSEQARWRDSVQDARDFYSSPFSFDQFVNRMTRAATSTVIALDGFLPAQLPQRGIASAPELFALQNIRSSARRQVPMFDIGQIAPFVGHMVDDTLEALFPMGPFRRPPERWYIFTGTSPEDVGYSGELLPDLLFRRPELVREANEWLRLLDIGYALRMRPIGQRGGDLFEMRLVDGRRKREVDVALSDVGFGISQILPFIVQTLASTERVISIEQPEVHLHPKLQADLGNLLAAAIGAPYEHQFLVETHSEHLILRLQKLVREQRVQPVDISVIFVSRGEGGSEARRLRLDDQGRFMDEWPGGFFAERLREFA